MGSMLFALSAKLLKLELPLHCFFVLVHPIIVILTTLACELYIIILRHNIGNYSLVTFLPLALSILFIKQSPRTNKASLALS